MQLTIGETDSMQSTQFGQQWQFSKIEDKFVRDCFRLFFTEEDFKEDVKSVIGKLDFMTPLLDQHSTCMHKLYEDLFCEWTVHDIQSSQIQLFDVEV